MSGNSFQVKLDDAHLRKLDEFAAREEKACWLLPGQLIVNDPELARSLLSNKDAAIIQHSDFFGERSRAVSPRSAQLEVSRACFHLIQEHTVKVDLGSAVDAIPSESVWPCAASLMLLDIMRPILAGPARSEALHRVLDNLVHDRIIGRYGRQKRGVSRLLGRFRYANTILREAEQPSHGGREDILAILADPARKLTSDSLIQLYTAFVFSLASSVALTLAWTIFLAVRNGDMDRPARHLVLESMRLKPVAWLLERQLDRATSVAGIAVTPPEVVVISPYTVHRAPSAWPDPTTFKPDRWAGEVDRRAWIPFGVGPQSCVAASFSLKLITQLVELLLSRPAAIEVTGRQPAHGAALAPPEFILRRKLSAVASS